jgi:rhamnogalacturonan endolyase
MLIWQSQDLEHISSVNIYRSETEDMASPQHFQRDKSLNTFTDLNLTTGKTYYYALSVVDTNDVESFRSRALGITPGPSFTFQSEDAVHIGTVFVEDNHTGFHGTAFTNFDVNNSAVEFTNMPGFGGGEWTLIFRYALGNTNRTGSLIVNGVAQSLTMTGTGEWTNYVLDSIGVTLNSGYDNTIRFSTTGNDFGNLDEITIVPRTITSVELADGESAIPSDFQLHQNYPNPFLSGAQSRIVADAAPRGAGNPQTTISFGLPEAAHVSIDVYNTEGRLVSNIVNGNYPAGRHEINFDGANLASGIYFVRSRMLPSSKAGQERVFTKKMMMLR